MTNTLKIEFNLDTYSNLLKTIKSNGFTFNGFSSKEEKLFLLRHDIDISPSISLKMAELEYNLNIKATYFFMIRSPFYNLFSRANNEIVKRIIELGHDIGLHYDEGYYSEKENLQNLIDREIKILKDNFQIEVNTVSFHQPSKEIIDNTVSIKQINTYDKVFFKNIKYISDSNMLLKENIAKIMQKYKKIQLLVHPIWWVACGDTTEEKFIDAIKINFELEQQQIIHTERAYGIKKIIEITKHGT